MFASCGILVVSSGLLFSRASGAATASFTQDGITGSVSVSDGAVTVSMDISGLDTSAIGGDSCFTASGFSYHIHEKWDHTSNDNKVGSTNCGSTFTGGHWDPWQGCGPATGNPHCDSKGSCVTGSSVLGDTGYSCNSANFAGNPYVCEVGDWSGKYGKVTVDDSKTMYSSNTNAYEADGTDLEGRSVVFHCSDGSRAFCAPFTNTDSDAGNNRPLQSETGKIANFYSLGDDSFIKLESDGSYNIRFMVDSLALPSNCDYLEYRVYNGWTNQNVLSSVGDNQCQVNGIGEFYDPTVSCAPDGDSEFCDYDTASGGGRCSDNNQQYMCDFEDDRFSCAPGDLSGKYGAIDTTSPGNGDIAFDTNGVDELMIDLRQLDGKSAVLQCRGSYEVVACAQFRDYKAVGCPAKCNDEPCNCGEAENCHVCHDGQGCSQCFDKYFRKDSSYQCSQCQEVFGNECLHCGDYQGCQQCAQGYFRVFDADCGLYYCL